MKYNTPPKVVARRGITLIELTVVIVVMMVMITLFFIAGRAWMRGSDRAACVLNLRNIQMATRSYQNMYGYSEGSRPDLRYGTRDIARHLMESGYITAEFYESVKGIRPCPGGGHYESSSPDLFPSPGQLYLQCSLAGSEYHALESLGKAEW